MDIGSHAIKCVEAVLEGGRWKITQAALEPVSGTTKTALTESLKKLFAQKTFSTKKVRISVSGPSLLIRRILLPKLTPAELKGAIRFEAESHIPFPIDDCILDFEILDLTPDKKQMNVMLVAAKKELVLERLQCVTDVGLEAELVDTDIFCVANAFEALTPEAEPLYGLLNLGHQTSSFVIVQNKRPFYVREIAWGGREVTKALAEIRGLAESDAEKIKMANAEADRPDIAKATQRGIELVGAELRHSIDYFENESGETLKWIGLSGGTSALPHLAQPLSEELGKELAPWNPVKNVEVVSPADPALLAARGCEFAVALGLALRELKTK